MKQYQDDKINSRFKLFDRKNKYLIPLVCMVLCNVLIQSHFDHFDPQSGILTSPKRRKTKSKSRKINALKTK